MHKILALATIAALTGHSAMTQQAMARENPLLAPSGLFFAAPRFDRITDADWRPALDAAMRAHDAEIAHIATATAKPTFANTIVALEASGAQLVRVGQIFNNITQANSDPTLDALRETMAPLLQAHQDRIYLNPILFARVNAVHAARATLKLDAKSAFLLQNTWRSFVRAGAALSPDAKVKLADLNQRIAKLESSYATTLVAATKDGAVLVTDPAKLRGLSPEDIAAAAQAAAESGKKNAYLLRLQNTTRQPMLATLADRDTRLQLLAASEARGTSGTHDLRPTITQLASLRADRAQVLGFADFASYTLDAQMAKTPAAAMKLLDGLVPATVGKAHTEAADIQAVIDRSHGGFTVTAADWEFYAQIVRHEKYDLDEAAVRPYFELNRVLKDGVFYAANKLYGITFVERHDIPVYQPDVRVFAIYDADKKPLALFYADYFARPNKQGGAWCDNFLPPAGLWQQKSVVVNVANLTKPAPGKPALISFDDVTTLFHEFGHALHTIFSGQTYPSQNGFGVPTDVVEFPSQFNEHWALDKTVFANYAHHYQTNAAMPADMVAKLLRARTFNQGYGATEIVAAALLDLEWHSIPAGKTITDVAAFEAAALHKHGIDIAMVPPRYKTAYFNHIWGGGYAANYYSYLWGEILDDDAYEWFTDHGGLTRANGQRFRDMMLAPGYSAEPMALYEAFRGRAPTVDALSRNRGLDSHAKSP